MHQHNHFHRFKKEDILVKLGEYDFETEGETGDQTFTVLSMKNHENYNDVTFENDIAIIKLDRPAILSNSVWPICLPPASERFTNRRAFVIGNLESIVSPITSLLPPYRLGHHILRRPRQLYPARGECASVGAQ